MKNTVGETSSIKEQDKVNHTYKSLLHTFMVDINVLLPVLCSAFLDPEKMLGGIKLCSLF